MKYIIFNLIVFLSTANDGFAHREKTYYLTGMVGADTVGLRIDEFGDACFARYFTKSDLFDKVLEGEIQKDNRFILRGYEWDSLGQKAGAKEFVSIVEDTNHNWNGIWEKDGVAHTVFFKPINIDLLNHPYKNFIIKYFIDPYASLRLLNINVVYEDVFKLKNKIQIQKIKDSFSGVSFFQVKENSNLFSQTDSINFFLQYQFFSFINSKYSCVHANNIGEYHVNYHVKYVDRNFISYTYNVVSSCYGGPLDSSAYILNLSMQNAKRMMLEDIYWLSEKTKTELVEGEYEWYQYRYKEFGPKLYHLLCELYPKKFNKENSDEIKKWQFPVWYLTYKGLHLKGSTIRKSKKEMQAVIIPYKKLQAYLVKDFELKK